MFVQTLQRYPFLRLFLALAVGIVCGEAFPYDVPVSVFGIGMGLSILFLYGCYRRNGHVAFGTGLFVIGAALGFCLIGWQLSALQFPFSGQEEVYQVVIREHPEEKNRSILCRSAIREVRMNDSTLQKLDEEKLFLLYFPKDSVARQLRRGDMLWISARLSPPANNGNPDEFDYARFLRHRGVCGTGYVASGHWKRSGRQLTVPFRQQALDQREKVVAYYRQLGFQGDELAVLSALTVGDKDDLSEDITETYSVTGASHVLALSGLHIGFLYALFWFLFSPLWRRFKPLKPVLLGVIICCLWGFAFLTGLAPSVVRSVIMFSLLALSCLQSEKALSANTLAATAFLMLLYNPCWLFDVGFQLSFTAVAAILIFHPLFYAWCPTSNRLVRKVWGLMSLSVAAQIGTAPLVIFYFSRFSTHFLFTNLWVIPLASLIMYAGVLLLLLAPFPALQPPVAFLTEKLLQLQNEGLRHIEQWPYASIDHCWLDGWEVALFYLAILLLYRGLRMRTAGSLRVALGAFLLLAAYDFGSSLYHKPRPGFAFYQVRGCPAVHCLTDGTHSWLVCADSLPDVSWLTRSLAPHWNRLHLDTPQIITDSYQAPDIQMQNHIVNYRGKRICLLNDDRWRYHTSPHPLPIDYAYISKGYKDGVSELSGLFTIRQVIIDSSLTPYYRKQVIEDCQELHIPYRLLEEEGCIRIAF